MGKVAVIMRTKNRAILLKRALQSVIAQTYSNWILIVVNDGGGPEEVNRLINANKDQLKERIKVIHNPASVGMEAASNIGIRSVESDYVVIHDDDDSWDPLFLERTVGFLESEQSQGYEGVATKVIKVVEEIKGENVEIKHKEFWRPEISTIILAEMANRNQMVPISFLYRKRVHDAIGYYDESLPVLGDWEFNIRFLLKYDVFLLHDALANYHHRLSIKTGEYSNSAAAATLFHTVRTRIKNKYLRSDIEQGKFGLGWVLNSQQSDINDLVINYSVQFMVKQLIYNQIKRVVIYGTGNYSLKLMLELALNGVHIEGIIDSNSSKWGKTFNNYPIQSLDHYLTEDMDPIIIGSYSYAEEIIVAIKRRCQELSMRQPMIVAP
ncbi:glycosyltransferase family 2 protein [Cohnella fermenti]|uniref:Glycosyltransferase family 2 protein n=1 Tax=Cohnella fermenti TaxID=2565925 RepID=A0A4S4C1F5_9BACL|nr:glycosyltransferase family 2 protein [Cohnella fermenti]THF80794.1 glycosyltransferase family 2 protein [Cohnella fermenti]